MLKLKKIGVKVTVYNEAKMKKLGMYSLLGVGRGSSKQSYLVTLEWYGNKKNKNNYQDYKNENSISIKV